ncbi:MAG: hypothetical protein EBU88_05935 [Acidobacteria bacterium]|nr:hypothetical protein [Acidobacteriota bacterium]
MIQQRWYSRLLNRLRGRDPIAEYFAWLVTHGRIAEGRILDISHGDDHYTIYYRYSVSNVHYETSHHLTTEQVARVHLYVPGANVSVRFDPRRPGVSRVT